MDKPHATPARFDGPTSGQPDLVRAIVLPAAGAVILVALFFLILLGPSRRAAAPEAPQGVEPAPESASASATARVEPPRCDVPVLTGEVGVVSRRFDGKQTSSGHRYDPDEAVCIANAATPFGDLAYGTEVSLARTTAPDDVITCRVVGRWNGERHTDRILLLSSRLARSLDIGDNGLAEVRTGCARGDGHTRLASN